MLLQKTALGDITEFSTPCTYEILFVYTLSQSLTWWSLFKFLLKHLAQHLFLRLSQHYSLLYVRMKVTFPSRADISDSA